MDINEAVIKRKSIRKYAKKELSDEILAKVADMVNEVNAESGLNIKVMTDGKAFMYSWKNLGAFSNVQYYLEMIGDCNLPNLYERVGYYGEKIVLELVRLGLGTCWVSGTFNRSELEENLNPSKNLVCVIAFGYSDENVEPTRSLFYKATHIIKKPLKDYYESDIINPPEWFLNGIKAASYAPSALNTKPYSFKFFNGEVTAKRNSPIDTFFIDLGIAKRNFEIGAVGKFALGEDGKFDKQ